MGQTSGACRPQCQLGSCKHVDTENTGLAEEMVVKQQGGAWTHGFGCCPENDIAAEQVTVVQECCITSAFEKQVHLVTQRPWSDLGSMGLQRRQLLAPHTSYRFHDYYDVGRKLGEGSFGDVHEALARRVDPQTAHPYGCAEGDVAGGSYDRLRGCPRCVAVKVFHLNAKGAEAGPGAKQDNQKKRSSFEAEQAMLSDLEHPHIIRMHECFEEANALIIVLELCRGGELYSRLVGKVKENGKASGGLDEPIAKNLFRQMLYAVAYLHARWIVHRDIKTENFLLVGERGSSEGETLKLCDFGTSARLSATRPRSMENIGTLSYTAPEVYANKGAAVAADCWSLGVVLYVMVTGTNPFRSPGRNTNREETVKRIRAGDFEQRRKSWLGVSSSGQDMVKRFLVLDEPQRLTCTQALVHEWLEDRSPLDSARSTDEAPLARPAEMRGSDPAAHAPQVIALLLRVLSLAPAQRLAVQALAMAASEADVQSTVPWREIFITLDADKDGRLSFSEIVQGLRALLDDSAVWRSADDKLEDCARALDLDGSGFVEWTEWLALALLGSKGASQAEEPLSTAFRLIDRTPEALPPKLDTDEAPLSEQESPPQAVPMQVSQTIAQWMPKQGLLPPEGEHEGRRLTMQHFRAVLSSLQVHEML